MLSDSESDSQDVHTLTINEHYAKAFEYRKEREELAKLKEKYGSDYSDSGPSNSEDSDDSEDTEEDTDGEELTPAMDAAILRTLARIRKKDPGIYQGGRRVFEEEHTRTQDKAPAKRPKAKGNGSRPLTIREAALASALADADPRSRSPSLEPRPLTHTEEQVLLRSETRAAFHGAVNSEAQDDDNDNDLLVPRSRTRDEIEEEEEEYKAFLQREVGEDLHDLIAVDANDAVDVSEATEIDRGGTKEPEGKKKKGKKEREKVKQTDQEKDKKKDKERRDKKSKQEADQDFLMNYIFNRGWVDHSSRRLPTYNEIVDSASKRSKTIQQADSDGDGSVHHQLDGEHGEVRGSTLSDEDSFDDLADAFETSYNFRFEEPGGGLITSYPRDVASARRESSTRKDARKRRKERQEAEKHELLQTRREEIRKERALAEAVVAEDDPNNTNILVAGNDTSNKKLSKKQQRKAELARLKALRANELRRKLEMVSSEGGLGEFDDKALAHLDLDADWDPRKHDAQMAELYAANEDINDDSTKKPVWDDDINIDDIELPMDTKTKAEQKKQRKKEKRKNRNENGDVGVDVDEMDADLDTGTGWGDWEGDGEEWKGTEAERKRKVDAYMDEVINRLGFSGITSHMPTRFHYTSTMPENYGLSPVEILLSTDAELNSYIGLKKLAPYRVARDGKAKKSWDPKRAQRLKEFRETLHSRMGSRYDGVWALGAGTRSTSTSRAADMQGEKKKRKGKKERAKLRAALDEDGGEDEVPEGVIESKKRKHESDTGLQPQVPHLGETRADVEGGLQRKKRRRQHKKKAGERDTDAITAQED